MAHTPTAAHLAGLLDRAGLLDARTTEQLPLHPETVARRAVAGLHPGLAAVAESLGLRHPSRGRAHAAVLLVVRLVNRARRVMAVDVHGWIAGVDRAINRAAAAGHGPLDDERLAQLRRRVVDELLVSLAAGLDAATDAHLEADDGSCSCEVAEAARHELGRRWVTLAEEGIASGDPRAADEALALSQEADEVPNVALALHYARLATRWGADDDDPHRRVAQWERLLGANLAVGAWEEAASAGARALRLAEEHLAPGDSRRLAITDAYARALAECDRDEEALALARDVVWTCECEWGATSQQAWRAYELLGGVLEALGEVDAAIEVRRHRVELHRAGLLDVAPRRLIGAGFDLATTYLRAGDGDAAERTAREWLRCSESRLGPGERLTHLLRGLVSSFG